MAERLRNIWNKAESLIQPLGSKSVPSSPPMPTRTLSPYEVTSLKIKQLLEHRKFKECEDLIKQKPHDYLISCLEKFPFMTMNRLVPESLPVWEVLLSRLHTREDGYIPQFPYSACDNLVMQLGRALQKCDSSPQSTGDLRLQCRRVLKKVYMLYEGVLDKACLFHERVSGTLCSLAKHRPLGLDTRAKSLQETIKDEIDASLLDFQEASDQLQEAMEKELMSLPEMLQQNSESSESSSSSLADLDGKTCSMLQIQERLYFNQTILRTVQPRKRKGNLSELSELLLERINGDKDALHLIAQMRMDDPDITADQAVEPHLRDCLYQLDLVISMLKDIEQELQINMTRSTVTLDHNDLHIPVSCEENGHPPKHIISSIFSDDGSDTEADHESRPRSSSSTHPCRQPLLRDDIVSTPSNMTSTRKSSFSVHSADSIHSVRGGNLIPVRNDVACDRKRSNTLPSNRASSNPNLLSRPTNGILSGNGSIIAGMRRALFGGMNPTDHRSHSVGNIALTTTSNNKRFWMRSTSPGSPMLPENGASAVSGGSKSIYQLHHELEMKRSEVAQLQDQVQQLRFRERELMNRSV